MGEMKKDPWRCPNGHLMIIAIQGYGCLRADCPHRIPQKVPPKKKDDR